MNSIVELIKNAEELQLQINGNGLNLLLYIKVGDIEIHNDYIDFNTTTSELSIDMPYGVNNDGEGVSWEQHGMSYYLGISKKYIF